MRTTSATVASWILSGARTRLDVQSWLGGEWLGGVPVVSDSWQVTEDHDTKTGGSLRFQVPATPEWIPLDDRHPLAPMGQTLTARVGVDVHGEWVWFPMGRFRPASRPVVDHDVVSVTADSILADIERARFLQPVTLPAGTLRTAAAAQILRGVVPFVIDDAVPADWQTGGAVWDRERIDALIDLCEGWGTRYWMDDAGVVRISPKLTGRTPEIEFRDGDRGRLVDARPVDTEARAFNAYVVTNQPQGQVPPVSAIATIDNGPLRWGGPYGFQPAFFSTPTLPADQGQLLQIAKNLLERSRMRLERLTAECLPDPRVNAGTVVRVASARSGIDVVGRVLTARHEPRRLTLTVGVIR